MAKRSEKRLIIMVSSTVYGIEELLEKTYAMLAGFGYEVWMSHKGTMPVLPDLSNFENCLAAVEACDLFLGIITPQYGSGKDDKGARSITHEELLRAIKLNKPRWILAHDYVVFARGLLRDLGYGKARERGKLSLRPKSLLEDLRVIDMYEAAIQHDIQLKNRKGNWVQTFVKPEDALLFESAQFYRYQEVEDFLKKQFSNSADVRTKTQGGKSK